MNIPPHYGKERHGRQAPPPSYMQSYPASYMPDIPGIQGPSYSGSADNSERRQLSQYRTQHYPPYSRVQTYHDINDAFNLLKSNPRRALDEAETL
ncbi:hypothetical protein, partial [Sansalvadorimonas verongulae]|uniref:hypothetical protein n=1 Tax=Sansalvadorimonas verongulae TaxID=2172824 RepID=UPI001E3980BB